MKTKEKILLKDFGKFIVNRRKELNLSQRQLLNSLGECGYRCTQGMLAQIETGHISNPNKNFLYALAQSLKVEFDVVMFEFVADKYGWTPKIANQESLVGEFEPMALIFFVRNK